MITGIRQSNGIMNNIASPGTEAQDYEKSDVQKKIVEKLSENGIWEQMYFGSDEDV